MLPSSGYFRSFKALSTIQLLWFGSKFVRQIAMVRFGFFILFFVFKAYADLTLWSPAGHNITYVLPEGISPQIYLQNMKSYPELSGFVEYLQYSPQDQIRVLKNHEMGSAEHTILVANSVDDHTKSHTRVNNFGRHFSQTFVFPVGAALRLSEGKETAFYQDLAKKFGLFVFMGGDDKHPGLYGERTTWSAQTNRMRDQLEQKLVRHIYYRTSARIFGVCRGLQQVFTSLGGKLYQDIPNDLHAMQVHTGRVMHPIVFTKTKNSLIRKMFSDLPQTMTLSEHHQAARPESVVGTVFEIAALSTDGVVEALESRDRRIVLVQFHPEKIENLIEYTEKFFDRLKNWANSEGKNLCKKLF